MSPDAPGFDPKLTEVRVRDLFPGCWEDGNGNQHFSLPEILDHLGIPDIPEEHEENMRLLQQALRDKLPPGSEISTRTTPEPPPPLS